MKIKKETIDQIMKILLDDHLYDAYEKIPQHLWMNKVKKFFRKNGDFINFEDDEKCYELLSLFFVDKEVKKIHKKMVFYGDNNETVDFIVDKKTITTIYKLATYDCGVNGTVFEDLSPIDAISIKAVFKINDSIVLLKDTINGFSIDKTFINVKDEIVTNFENGKNEIKSYFFKPTLGILYIVKLNVNGIITQKIGITKSNISERFGKSANVLSQKIYKMTMLEAAIIEKSLHKMFAPFRDKRLPKDFAGKTECYNYSIMSLEDFHFDINNVMTFLDIDKYLNLPLGTTKRIIEYQRKELGLIQL